MQKWKILIVSAITAAMILGGCTSAPTPAADSLAGTSWSLVTLNGQPAVADTQVTINFEDGNVNGSDGCNHYGAAYTVKGDKIILDKNIATTLMACPEPIMQQASAYTIILTQAAKYKIDGQQFTLLDAGGITLATFKKQSSGLGGTSWTVTGYNNGKQAVVSVINGMELTADFSADGKISGFAGCNNYTAAVEVSGKGIKIGAAASTRKMCAEPAGVMDQEAQFLQALATAATYRLDGDKLELRTADGALAVSFARGSTAVKPPTEDVEQSASIAEALPNAEYPIADTSTGKAKLKDGLFEEFAAPGSATKTRVQLGREQAFGDVNGDGAQDAAVTLVVDPGGTGTFTYLALVINDKGIAKPLAALLLGDRIVVKSLAIQPGGVVVFLLTRKPDEPISVEPTVEITRTFKLQGDTLVEVK